MFMYAVQGFFQRRGEHIQADIFNSILGITMKVFISHSRSDTELAKRAAAILRKSGLETWSSENLLPGDNWAVKHAVALESSDAMIILISSSSPLSSEVLSDLSFALGSREYKHRVIPVLRKSSDFRFLDEMPWVLKRLKTFDLERYSEEESGFTDLAAWLKAS